MLNPRLRAQRKREAQAAKNRDRFYQDATKALRLSGGPEWALMTPAQRLARLEKYRIRLVDLLAEMETQYPGVDHWKIKLEIKQCVDEITQAKLEIVKL
jgi:hypothetical protein